jgi:hypothetical protein
LQLLGFAGRLPHTAGALKTAIKRLDCAPACRLNPEGRGAKLLPRILTRIQQTQPKYNNEPGMQTARGTANDAVFCNKDAVFCNKIESIKSRTIRPIFQLWKQWKRQNSIGLDAAGARGMMLPYGSHRNH